MVRRDAIEEAAELGPRAAGACQVGLHVDLSEWVYRDGEWAPLYEVVAGEDRAAVEAEVAAQLASFLSVFGGRRRISTRIQHRHLEEPVRSVVVETGARLGVPVRECTPRIQYRGDFLRSERAAGEPVPQAITVDALLGLLGSLPDGVTRARLPPRRGGGGGVELLVRAAARARGALATRG
jgi:hypothetical protein